MKKNLAILASLMVVVVAAYFVWTNTKQPELPEGLFISDVPSGEIIKASPDAEPYIVEIEKEDGSKVNVDISSWDIYRHEYLGFEFRLPPGFEVEEDKELGKTEAEPLLGLELWRDRDGASFLSVLIIVTKRPGPATLQLFDAYTRGEHEGATLETDAGVFYLIGSGGDIFTDNHHYGFLFNETDREQLESVLAGIATFTTFNSQ